MALLLASGLLGFGLMAGSAAGAAPLDPALAELEAGAARQKALAAELETAAAGLVRLWPRYGSDRELEQVAVERDALRAKAKSAAAALAELQARQEARFQALYARRGGRIILTSPRAEVDAAIHAASIRQVAQNRLAHDGWALQRDDELWSRRTAERAAERARRSRTRRAAAWGGAAAAALLLAAALGRRRLAAYLTKPPLEVVDLRRPGGGE